MKSRIPILLASHALVFGAAWEWCRTTSPGRSGSASAMPAKTKSAIRETRGKPADGSLLLADFRDGKAGEISKYRTLKESLPAAADVKAAAMADLATLDQFWTGEWSPKERHDRMARLEVRVLRWMRQDPAGAMDFLVTDETCKKHRLPDQLCDSVFKDIVAEKGLGESLGWLSKSPRTAGVFCDAALAAMKQDGGGIGAVAKLVSAMESDPGQAAYLLALSEGIYVAGREIGPFFSQAGAAVRFEEREKLMDFAKSRTREKDQLALLEGFARNGPEAVVWLRQAATDGTLKGYVAGNLEIESQLAMRYDSSLPLEQRVAIVEAAGAKDHLSSEREDIVSTLVRWDVEQSLKTGRDWGYEFHHGDVTAEEVLAEMKSALPGSSAEGEPTLREALYQELAKENPEAALSLLADFPEEKRRKILFGPWSLNFSTAEPGLYCSFLATLPERPDPEEKQRMEGGFAYLAKRMLDDGGVFWSSLDAMPAAARSGAAMTVIVSETRKVDPAKAAKLEKLFSTLRP